MHVLTDIPGLAGLFIAALFSGSLRYEYTILGFILSENSLFLLYLMYLNTCNRQNLFQIILYPNFWESKVFIYHLFSF